MKATPFSNAWQASKRPRKQRNYRTHAPLHKKAAMISAHLTKELRAKHKTRAIPVRTGDKVKIMRGQFRSKEGRVERVDVRRFKVYVSKIEQTKKDGSKSLYGIDASNLLLTELASDKRRFKHYGKTTP